VFSEGLELDAGSCRMGKFFLVSGVSGVLYARARMRARAGNWRTGETVFIGLMSCGGEDLHGELRHFGAIGSVDSGC
jgi:hypothetical protein